MTKPIYHCYEELDAIPYYDEKGQLINHMHTERIEQMQAREHIPEDGTVLELGARYGTVSCSINASIRDPTRQVVIEPDKKVIDSLTKNRNAHNCQFSIFEGIVSERDMVIANPNIQDQYGIYTTMDVNAGTRTILPRISLQDLESQYNMKFDCLVADCEGGLYSFVQDYSERLKDFRVIIFEKDYPALCDYAFIEDFLRKNGFECIVYGFHSVWKKN